MATRRVRDRYGRSPPDQSSTIKVQLPLNGITLPRFDFTKVAEHRTVVSFFRGYLIHHSFLSNHDHLSPLPSQPRPPFPLLSQPDLRFLQALGFPRTVVPFGTSAPNNGHLPPAPFSTGPQLPSNPHVSKNGCTVWNVRSTPASSLAACYSPPSTPFPYP